MSVLRPVSVSRWATLVAALTVLSVVASACGGGSTEPAPRPAPAEAAQPTAAPRPSAQEGSELTVALASTDLAVGGNRVAFGLIDPARGAIKGAPVQVQTFLLVDPAEPAAPQQTVEAEFREWPGGFGGVYVVRLTFDQPGEWGLAMFLMQPDGTAVRATTIAQVGQQSRTPPIGSPAPPSANKTARDVADLEDLTTDTAPDPELYAMTIAEALQAAAPLIVTFATPAYCTSATCGPQVDVLKELKATYRSRVNFIHVEVYDNPPDIRDGGIERARVSPTMFEWNLTTEPWTFVMDGQGVVRAKYEGFVGAAELEEAINEVLQ